MALNLVVVNLPNWDVNSQLSTYWSSKTRVSRPASAPRHTIVFLVNTAVLRVWRVARTRTLVSNHHLLLLVATIYGGDPHWGSSLRQIPVAGGDDGYGCSTPQPRRVNQEVTDPPILHVGSQIFDQHLMATSVDRQATIYKLRWLHPLRALKLGRKVHCCIAKIDYFRRSRNQVI